MLHLRTTLATLLIALASAAAHALPGQLDPTFGAGGAALYGVDQRLFNYVTAVVVQGDGKLILADFGGSTQDLYRLLPGGTMDTSYGTGGRVTPGTNYLHGLQLQADGKLLACGGSGAFDVLRYKADGTLDTTWGTGGLNRTTLAQDAVAGVSACALDAAGRLVVSGHISEDGIVFRGVLLRLLPSGARDTTFGTAGVVQLAAPGYGASIEAFAFQADGKIVVAGYAQQAGITYAALARYKTDGTLDPAFGTGGIALDLTSGTTLKAGSALAVAVLPSGRIVMSQQIGEDLEAMPLVAFTATGQRDTAFGDGGRSVTGMGALRSIAVTPDGKLLVAGTLPSGSTHRPAVARLSADGVLDVTWGVNGVAAYADAQGADAIAMAQQPDGKTVIAGPAHNFQGGFDLLLVRFLGDEIKGTVVEFYNSVLDHYFVTANPAEATAIDGGAAGPGWSRTGLSFKSGGMARVCRFYGSTDIDPATGKRRGPNSHFYTIDTAECGQVRQDPGWHFESYDFSSNPRLAATCAAGTVPVYRAYNQRFAQNDSNHRLTADLNAYNQTVGRGWSGEGVVMCAPQ